MRRFLQKTGHTHSDGDEPRQHPARTSLLLVPAMLGLLLGAMLAWGNSGASGAGTDAVAGGLNHSCALRGGAVSCWGLNTNGQLGDGSNAQSLTPVAVVATGMGAGVTAIATGDNHSCAIDASGGVWCWGSNANGQLGNNSITDSNVPVAVSGLSSGVTSISAGGSHTCAVQSGAAKCWGWNNYGQLGDGSIVESHVPVAVAGSLGTLADAVAAGQNFACAIRSGAAWCWGQNANGQIGNGTAPWQSTSPVSVTGLGSGVTAITAGYNHACAIQSGAAFCWGKDTNGQLGNAGNTDQGTPVAGSAPLTSGVTAIDGGGAHTCAIVSGGAWCWGAGTNGRLGNGANVDSNVPVSVNGLASNVTAITAGGIHSCAVQNGGAVCWGLNTNGQLGNNSTTNSNVPVGVSGAIGATDTPTPTNTATPTDTPTVTNTPVATNTPTATNTPAPTSTSTSTPTPTDTPAPTSTNTPGPSATPTDTAVPATATNTSVPATATNTSVPATATNTPVPGTATATNTSAPGGGGSTRATATPTDVPATEVVPTDTPAVAAPPQSGIELPNSGLPGGGAAGAGIGAPNTGSGPGDAHGVTWWLLAAGLALAAMGGATAFAGTRRR